MVLSDTLPESSSDSMFGANRWTRMGDIKDGTSNTIMVVEVRDPVPWTQPDTDLHFGTMNFQMDGGPQSIGSFHPGGAMVLFADGSVQFLGQDHDSQRLRLPFSPPMEIPCSGTSSSLRAGIGRGYGAPGDVATGHALIAPRRGRPDAASSWVDRRSWNEFPHRRDRLDELTAIAIHCCLEPMRIGHPPVMPA